MSAADIQRYRVDTEVLLGTDVWRLGLDEFLNEVSGPGMVVVGSRTFSPAERTGMLDRIRLASARVRILPPGNVGVADLAEWSRDDGSDTPPNWLVAIGGGRTIDLAKVLALRAGGQQAIQTSRSVSDLQAALRGGLGRVPLCVVPTVAGSGAEVSALSDVLTTPDGVRMPVMSPLLFPDSAVIDADVLASAPAAAAKAAVVDALMHVVDPWINVLPDDPIQGDTSAAVAGELVGLARAMAERPLPSRLRLNLARVSHLALRPGLARTAAHASNIHRIEHALPDGRFRLHGVGLAYVALRFLTWLESNRRTELAPVADALNRVFGARRLPSAHFQELFRTLRFPALDAQLPAVEVTQTTARVATHFLVNGELPGNLGLGRDEVGDILRVRPAPAAPARYRPLLRRHPPSPRRVLGLDRAPEVRTVVLTPIPRVFDLLAHDSMVHGHDRAWYPALVGDTFGEPALHVRVPPGGAGLVEALNLTRSLVPMMERAVFLGYAGALDESVPLGTCLRPRTVMLAARRRPQPELAAADTMTLPDGRDPVVAASVTQLAEESDVLFDYFAWRGVSLVDLEVSGFCQWCADHSIRPTVLLSASDRPHRATPIWALNDDADTRVLHSAATSLVTGLSDAMTVTPHRAVVSGAPLKGAHDAAPTTSHQPEEVATQVPHHR